MDKASRVEIDERGAIVHVDAAFCALVHDIPERLIGMQFRTLTAYADRAKSAALFTKLREQGTPFTSVKRLVRRDLSHVWVFTRSELLPAADGERRFGITICESAPPLPLRDPAKLLGAAYYMVTARRQRKTIFGSALFHDHAWDMISLAYIAEAEGTVLTFAELAAETGLSAASLVRYISALCAEELLECDGDDHDSGSASVRLSALGHRKFEEHLGRLCATVPDEDELVE